MKAISYIYAVLNDYISCDDFVNWTFEAIEEGQIDAFDSDMIVKIQVRKLANPLFTRVCEFFVLCRFCVWVLFGCYCDKNLRSRLRACSFLVGRLFRLTFPLPREDIRHSSESLRLSVLKGGCVYVKGGACLRVSENALNCLDVNARAYEQACV